MAFDCTTLEQMVTCSCEKKKAKVDVDRSGYSAEQIILNCMIDESFEEDYDETVMMI